MTRAERDDDLASCIGLRPDLPRHHYLKLVAKASLTVRRKLEAAHPELADDVSSVVQGPGRRICAAGMTRQTERARALVKSLHEDGRRPPSSRSPLSRSRASSTKPMQGSRRLRASQSRPPRP